MEKLIKNGSIPCSLHPSQLIQKIDPSLGTKKHIYCCDCILEHEDPKLLAKSLQTLETFFATAEKFYTDEKNHIPPNIEPHAGFFKLVALQEEGLQYLTLHVEQEKLRIEDFFGSILRSVVVSIEQKKNEYIEALNHEFIKSKEFYVSLGRKLKRMYPKDEEFSNLFPSKDNLEKKLTEITQDSELTQFIEDLKRDISQSEDRENFYKQGDEAKAKYFGELSKQLENIQLPEYEIKDSVILDIEKALKECITQILTNSISLKNPVPNGPIDKDYPKSNIITNKEFQLLRDWIPKKFDFSPKLIYDLSRDGAGSFHKHCDGKGPTITIIHAYFVGTEDPCVFGGFLDKSWHQQGTI